MTYRLFILCVVLVHPGCARRQTAAPAARQVTIQPNVRAQTYACLQQVLQLPATDVAANDDDGQHVADETFAIDTPLDIAADGERYSPHVNTVNQSAYITSAGGIGDNIQNTYGPWPSTSPQVASLIQFVRGSKESANAAIQTE